MEIFDFISSREEQQKILEARLKELEGRKALLDPHQQEYKLIRDSIKEVQIKLAYLEREISQFVESNC